MFLSFFPDGDRSEGERRILRSGGGKGNRKNGEKRAGNE